MQANSSRSIYTLYTYFNLLQENLFEILFHLNYQYMYRTYFTAFTVHMKVQTA